MFVFNPIRGTEWFITLLESRAVVLPYALVVPYITCELECMLLFQVIVAPVCVGLAIIIDSTGVVLAVCVVVVAVTALVEAVVNSMSLEVAMVPEALPLTIWK